MSQSDASANQASAAGELSAQKGHTVVVVQADYAQLGLATTKLLHDFKNQLGGLKLYTSFLKSRISDNADAVGIVEKIMQGLDGMADNASSVGRLAHVIELKIELGDIAALVQQAVTSGQTSLAGKPVRIENRVTSDLPPVRFDQQRMLTVVEGVLDRAIAVTPENGEVQLGCRTDGKFLVIAVADEGGPLNAGQREHFFSLQAPERMSKAMLDLAYAARIVQAHQGWIAVQSLAERVTVVELALPLEF